MLYQQPKAGLLSMAKVEIGGKPVNLKDGEEIIWRGRPVQGIIRNPVHIGWGLAFLALGFWLAIGGFGPVLGAGAMLGLPLALAGGYLVFFHAKVERNRRADMYYALTTQRAILAYGRRALGYPVLPSFRITLKKGRYDVVFFAVDRQLGVQSGSSLRRVGFGHLENGDEVYALLLDIQKNAAKTPDSQNT